MYSLEVYVFVIERACSNKYQNSPIAVSMEDKLKFAQYKMFGKF